MLQRLVYNFREKDVIREWKENRMGTIGYLRVSTNEQDLEKNKADILHLANDKNLGRVQWIEEKISGRVH